jgi:hypothetical protein
MTSIFMGARTIRQEYFAALASQIATGTLAAPYQLATLQRGGRIYNIKNTTDVILRFFLVNPLDVTQTILFWFDLDPNENFGFDLSATPQQFELPAQVKVYCTGVTLAGAQASPSLGRVRMFSWG